MQKSSPKSSGRASSNKSSSARSSSSRSDSGRSSSSRSSSGRSDSGRSSSSRSSSGRSDSGRSSFGRSDSGRSSSERSDSSRSRFEKSGSERSSPSRSDSGRSRFERSSSERSDSGRSRFEKTGSERSSSGRSDSSRGESSRNSPSKSRFGKGGFGKPNNARGRAPAKPKQKASYIDPKRFVNVVNPDNAPKLEEASVVQHTFADFAFTPALQKNIAQRGYERPTPIQDKTIPVILEGHDLIGLANTGTGKTAAFILPIINYLQTNKANAKALVILPTRELALQVDDEFRAFSKSLKLFSAVCVGGASIYKQISALNRNPHCIIGTPGRLKDLYNQEVLKLDDIDILVLDEADRMLDMGFSPDIKYLIEKMPKERQTLCFSATITPSVEGLMQKILTKPVSVSVVSKKTSEHIEQEVIEAKSKEEKVAILTELLGSINFEKVIIFGKTKFGVQRLADQLTKAGLRSEAIHGDKSQAQRQRALKNFKEDKVHILVATDVAARGLDIPDVSHVINFDQPQTFEDYVHRIGRTGRAGKSGHAITFVEKK